MADVELVIKIPEETYIGVLEEVKKESKVHSIIYDAIANGKSLPKGHGDLIDKKEAIISLFDYYAGKKTVGQCIDEVQPIIEADKAESGDDCSDLCTMTTDASDFENEEYIEARLENYTKMLKSGILDCVMNDVGTHEDVDGSEE